MPIISKVGRKSPPMVAAISLIYLLLILLGLTMV